MPNSNGYLVYEDRHEDPDYQRLKEILKKSPHVQVTELFQRTGISKRRCDTRRKWFFRELAEEGRNPVRASGPASGTTAAPVSGGVRLAGLRTAVQKPQGNETKARLYRLKKDTAFPVKALSETWGVSEDTIKKHAKQYDAFRYVEISPGEWTPCVIHPDTVVDMES